MCDLARFVWLNPVIGTMLGSDLSNLEDCLEQRGDTPVQIPNLGLVVLEKYQSKLGQGLLIDARCPEAVNFIEKSFPELVRYVASIEPILIHGTRYLAEKHLANLEDELVMVTPCTAFSERYGEKFPPNISFIPWNIFAESITGWKTNQKPEATPVPPGFFNTLSAQVFEATGEEEIRSLLSEKPWENAQEPILIELLYCPGGCHTGDGMTMREGQSG